MAATTKVCPKCHQTLSTDSRYCPHDGAELKIKSEDRCCSHCGKHHHGENENCPAQRDDPPLPAVPLDGQAIEEFENLELMDDKAQDAFSRDLCPKCGAWRNWIHDGNVHTCQSCSETFVFKDKKLYTSKIPLAPAVEREKGSRVTVEQLKAAIAEQESKKSSVKKNLAILLLTLIVFFSLGLFKASLSGIIIIILVIFVHELGHLISMKIFGYRDVKMFFIPMLGAAASGRSVNPSGAQKAIVSLMGPIPGIIIGIVCAIAYFITQNEIMSESARIFLFINGFNLLPFYPLDGGRFFEFVLFSRNPKIEIVFKVITSLLLIATAFYLEAIFLGLFAYFVLISLKMTHIASTAAQEIRKTGTEDLDPDIKNIPENHLGTIIRALYASFGSNNPKLDKPNVYARHAETIWQKACNKPPSAFVTVALIVFYLVALPVGVAAPFIFEAGNMYAQTETEIIERVDEEGLKRFVEVQKYQGGIISEIPLDDGGFYNGKAHGWHVDSTQKEYEGHWKNGYVDGEWTYWDLEGQLTDVEHYEMGKPKKYYIPVDGVMTEVPEVDWPEYLRDYVQMVPFRSEVFKN